VAVNGAHFATFPHRVNMYSIKYFEVNGGVIADQIETSYQVNCNIITILCIRINFEFETIKAIFVTEISVSVHFLEK